MKIVNTYFGLKYDMNGPSSFSTIVKIYELEGDQYMLEEESRGTSHKIITKLLFEKLIENLKVMKNT